MTSAIQQTKPDDYRYALCDVCTKGFRATVAKFYAGDDLICADCEHKRLRLQLLREELKSAAKFGHVQGGGCALCSIQNQIDDLVNAGYDWREELERRVPTL
jgi:hypothetical protein